MSGPETDLVGLTRRSTEQTNERDFESAIAGAGVVGAGS